MIFKAALVLLFFMPQKPALRTTNILLVPVYKAKEVSLLGWDNIPTT